MITDLLAPELVGTDACMKTPLCLVSMPWPPVDTPSLALGGLSTHAAKVAPSRPVEQAHLYLDWYRVLVASFGAEQAADIYNSVAEVGAYTQIGDLIFSEILFASSEDVLQRFDEYIAPHDLKIPALADLRALATDFVRTAAARLATDLPERAVVGLSSTFVQTIPSLALAAALSDHRTDLTMVLGGSNMNRDRGVVLTRRFPFLDAVAVGEGEPALVQLFAQLDRGAALTSSSNLVVGGRAEVKQSGAFISLGSTPAPDHRPYFRQLEGLELSPYIEARLSYELSRGCWWGEKHHCTFCGLNGEGMEFRRKTGDHIVEEIVRMTEDHKVLDVIFTDNILHPRDIGEVFDAMPRELDLRMHLEVKANLKREDMLRLRAAGVWHLQPGIESLSRRALRLMRKGITPLQNVRFLRDAEELGMTSSWNILTHFPGELDRDYDEMTSQLERLFHLQPPTGVGPLAVVRYSPLFDDPNLGVAGRQPTPNNALVWPDLDAEEVEAMAEVFEPAERTATTISDELLAQIRQTAAQWRERYFEVFMLDQVDTDSCDVVRIDNGKSERLVTVSGDAACALWDGLRSGKTARGVERLIASVAPADGPHLIADWVAAGVLYRDDGGLITLPTRYEDHVPYRLRTY